MHLHHHFITLISFKQPCFRRVLDVELCLLVGSDAVSSSSSVSAFSPFDCCSALGHFFCHLAPLLIQPLSQHVDLRIERQTGHKKLIHFSVQARALCYDKAKPSTHPQTLSALTGFPDSETVYQAFGISCQDAATDLCKCGQQDSLGNQSLQRDI
jgi:hypothetical protein